MMDFVTVFGTLFSLIGIGIAIYQIHKTFRVAEAAQIAAEKVQSSIARNVSLADVIL